MKLKYLTNSPAQTKKLGEILAREILTSSKKHGGERKRALIIALVGNLGGGKTTFLQGFARGLRIKQKILSPTFIIMRKFKIDLSASRSVPKFKYFYHIDCYRIQKQKEILVLGLKKIVQRPQNIIAIEWADRIKEILPKDSLRLKFEFVNERARKIMLK
jgi:tRNA threonylcarbamoyladenosine biosynthesis protein TsaE